MDQIQKCHIDRTRELLNTSQLSQESIEAYNDLLTVTSLAANGCPPEDRRKHSTDSMLMLSNAIIRMAINTPQLISDGINQHLIKCKAETADKAALSWSAKGPIPAGSIKGGYAVVISIILLACVAAYGVGLYCSPRVDQAAVEKRIASLVVAEMEHKK